LFDLGRWLPEFPIREGFLYLDHAAICPLPRPVAEAMRSRIGDQETSGDLHYQQWTQHILTCRHLGAQLVGCSPNDITLIRSTSDGLSLIAEGLDWRPGDEVLIGEEEFAANVAPWLNLQSRGVVARRYPQAGGRVDPEEVARQLTPATRVVAVSWVAFHTGWIAPLAQLARICHDNGTLLVVDAIQGLGVLPMDMVTLGPDAVVADGHKWLLGPEGAGLMATTTELRNRLRPTSMGWRNVALAHGDFMLQRLEHLADGRKFEPGASNSVGIAGLAAALDLIFEVGPEVIRDRIETLARLLTRILISHGWTVVSPGSGHPVAGIVAARHSSAPAHAVVKQLAERRVVCSARQGLVRLSPHFYITKGELEAFDRILEKTGL